MCQIYESNRRAEDIQLKTQCIIISHTPTPSPTSLSASSQSPSDYITAQCQGSQPVGDKLGGAGGGLSWLCSSPTLDFPQQLTYTTPCCLSSSLLPSTHPSYLQPTPTLPFLHTHTITNEQGLQQQQQHHEMEISAACVRACSRWVQGQERTSVSDAWIKVTEGHKGRENVVEGRRGDISEAWRQWPSAFYPPSPIPITWIFARMCHNSSSCHCTGCLSFSTHAACENCSSSRMVLWHQLNTWMNAGSTGDLCFIVNFTSDLIFQVRPPFMYFLFYFYYYFWSCTRNHRYCSNSGGFICFCLIHKSGKGMLQKFNRSLVKYLQSVHRIHAGTWFSSIRERVFLHNCIQRFNE